MPDGLDAAPRFASAAAYRCLFSRYGRAREHAIIGRRFHGKIPAAIVCVEDFGIIDQPFDVRARQSLGRGRDRIEIDFAH